MLPLLVSLCLVATASACCMPDTWTASLGMQYAVWNETANNGTFAEGSIEIAFSAKNKIIAQNQLLMVNGKPLRQRLVMDYNQKITFLIQSDGTCTKHVLGDWMDTCLPANATATDNPYTYGLGDNTVKSNYYQFKIGNSEIYLMVTADTCVPVAEDIVTKNGPISVLTVLGYSNIKATIEDPQAFFVPVTCTNLLPILPSLSGAEMSVRSVGLQHAHQL